MMGFGVFPFQGMNERLALSATGHHVAHAGEGIQQRLAQAPGHAGNDNEFDLGRHGGICSGGFSTIAADTLCPKKRLSSRSCARLTPRQLTRLVKPVKFQTEYRREKLAGNNRNR
jgi:hypothetical protein